MCLTRRRDYHIVVLGAGECWTTCKGCGDGQLTVDCKILGGVGKSCLTGEAAIGQLPLN
jgi:hypothetical protein